MSGSNAEALQKMPLHGAVRAAVRGGVLMLAIGGCALAWSQPATKPGIYSCTDASGKKFTSDRPLVECSAREQRELNADGSVKRVVPPVMTSDERSDYEARQREEATRFAERQEAGRRDRNLLARFPNEEAHRKAREAALDDVRKALKQSEVRLSALAVERKPLTDESEFYVGKALPFKLKLALDANDASVDAQKTLQQNQKLEFARIETRYDAELDRLRKLWAGAQPGSMGVITGSASAPTRK